MLLRRLTGGGDGLSVLLAGSRTVLDTVSAARGRAGEACRGGWGACALPYPGSVSQTVHLGAPEPSALSWALEVVDRTPQVQRALSAVREASAQLRWHEALRRRWREARAEASVRGAVASASLEGAVVPAARMRQAVADGVLDRADSGDIERDAAAGLWRAGVRLCGYLPDLRGGTRPPQPTARALLTGVHRDVVGPLVSAGRLPLEEVGVPRRPGQAPREGGPGAAPDGQEAADRLAGVCALIDTPGLPALVRCALVHAELAVARPFTAGNAATGRVVARYLAARDGLEPTAVGVPDLYAARSPGEYAAALAGYAAGGADGVVQWVVWQARALVAGTQEGLELCRAIQTGSVR